MAIYSQPPRLGTRALDFRLPGVDAKTYSLNSFKEARALVVAFMCNHCPYVQAVQTRINALAKAYLPKGVALVGINSNDAIRYPDDSFEAMKKWAKAAEYVFPYLWDETQEVARAYGAVCTPEFYAFQNISDFGFVLKYQGRLDNSWKDEKAVTQKDLAHALDAILNGQEPSPDQHPSMGCSIKWK